MCVTQRETYQIPAFAILSPLCEITATISPNGLDGNGSCDVLLDFDFPAVVEVQCLL